MTHRLYSPPLPSTSLHFVNETNGHKQIEALRWPDGAYYLHCGSFNATGLEGKAHLCGRSLLVRPDGSAVDHLYVPVISRCDRVY